MYDLIIKKYRDKINEISLKEEELEISVAIEHLISPKLESQETEKRRYEGKDSQFLKKSIIHSLEEIIETNPEYPKALILLALLYFDLKKFKEAGKTAQKAHKMLDYQSVWYNIALELFQQATPHIGEYPEFLKYIDEISFDIKKTTADKQGLTLLCPKCGNFNEKKSKFCIICGNKFTKEDRKK